MGLGSFGGGAGAVRFLVEQGAVVSVTDLRPAEQLRETLVPLCESLGVPMPPMEPSSNPSSSSSILDPPSSIHWRLGSHDENDFTTADLIIVNPAVPKSSAYLQAAGAAGVPCTTEINLFFGYHPGPTLAVTGSNGKSTTTALAHSLLSAAGYDARLGGNIGKSLLPEVLGYSPRTWAVLELSSFQLEDLDSLECSPHVAIVTNFSPNHLDRHGTLDNYRRAKQTILRWQTPDDWAILNQDDADVRGWPTRGRRLFFGLTDGGREGLFATESGAVFRLNGHEQRLPIRNWLTLPGQHNLQNALAAACAALALGVAPDAVERGLRTFRSLPHRLEFVAETAGRRFYNDSLATTPESACYALAAFSEPILLLAGGYDKGVDLSGMVQAIVDRRVKGVAWMGQLGARLESQLRERDPGGQIPSRVCGDFAEAFDWCMGRSAPGDVILLSPGCASFDWFKNFADRGRQFCEMAMAWQPMA